MLEGRKITNWLASTRPLHFNLYCMVVAFATYFCMYAFRKPFTVGPYAGQMQLPFLPALDYKIILIIAQIFGYTLSKFIGIKVVSESPWQRRGWYLVASIVIAEFSLVGFAVASDLGKVFCLFINGIPLGMVWGFVFSFLEGRRATELLGATLSVSYIVSSGAVKSVGMEVMQAGVNPYWMPAVTGLIFLPLFLAAVKLLSLIPPPSGEEERLKTKRQPMNRQERVAFFRTYAGGLLPLVFFYMFLTAYRDFRDNFAREIWQDLGYGHSAAIFTTAEIPIALLVLVILAGLMFVRDNTRALLMTHCLLIAGSLTIGLSTWWFQHDEISARNWMMLVGLGCYLGYVPFGSVLYDRIIAVTGSVGTAGFMIYLTDAFGYVGSVSLLLFKNFATIEISWLDFFIRLSYLTAAVCGLGFLLPLCYFALLENRIQGAKTLHEKDFANLQVSCGPPQDQSETRFAKDF